MLNSVFIAGSRALYRLNPQVRERLDNIVSRCFSVLVGDASGVDKAVQQYLARQSYRSVTVYCMDPCRNNVGDWPVRAHTAEAGARRDRFYYGIKDAAMVRDATWGFMLWDGRSKGTLANTIGLLNTDKKVLLYLAPRRQFFNLHTFEHLCEMLNAIGVQDVEQFFASQGIRELGSKVFSVGPVGSR